MPQEFWTIFWSAIGTIVTALTSWGISRLIAWLNTKIKDEKMRQMAGQVLSIIQSAVQAIQQVFVDALKDDGKFDAKEQAIAKEKCLAIINEQLTPELTAYIQENFGDVQKYLSTQIEAVLYNLKQK